MTRSNECGIDEHRKRILCFAGFRHAVRVKRKIPGHEDFICSRTLPKDLFPCTSSLKTVCGPDAPELGNELFFSLLQVVHQLWRYLLDVEVVSDRAAIPRVWNHSNLVFDLNHDNGVIVSVDLAQVTHECGECPRICLPVF